LNFFTAPLVQGGTIVSIRRGELEKGAQPLALPDRRCSGDGFLTLHPFLVAPRKAAPDRRQAMLEHPRVKPPTKTRWFTNLYNAGSLRAMDGMPVNKS